jgi:hypothetical protein
MSDAAPPVALHPGERVLWHGSPIRHLRSTPARIGFTPVNGECWLTDQRLIFQPWSTGHLGVPVPVAYPLGRVAATAIVAVWVDLAHYQPVRLDFDDGGAEYFEVNSATMTREEWRQAIEAARAVAPMLPYETPPTQRPSVEGAGRRVWRFVGLLVAGIILGCLAVCLVLALLGSLLPERSRGTPAAAAPIAGDAPR